MSFENFTDMEKLCTVYNSSALPVRHRLRTDSESSIVIKVFPQCLCVVRFSVSAVCLLCGHSRTVLPSESGPCAGAAGDFAAATGVMILDPLITCEIRKIARNP